METKLTTTPLTGLTESQVSQAIANKQTNRTKKVVGKSYLQIFASNIFTFFNFVGIVIFALMIFTKQFGNAFFFVVIFANTVIGIVQEIRSKRAIERLSVVSQPTAKVIRNGAEQIIDVQDVVLGDVINLQLGNQVCTDCVVLQGEVEVNESILTGESDSVKKTQGDKLLCGSFVVSGNCLAQAEHVGADNYIECLSAKVKKTTPPNSQVMNSIRAIIKVLGISIVPFAIITFVTNPDLQLLTQDISFGEAWTEYWRNYFVNWQNNCFSEFQQGVNSAISRSSGSSIGMIPSGMVLLLAISFALSALKLAQRKVLVRELPCIEMLARVDTLCLDKTGTITDGTMNVEQIVCLRDGLDVTQLVATLVNATGDNNITAQAIRNFVKDVPTLSATNAVAFSSQRKYSACDIDGIGTVAMGATEFVFGTVSESLANICNGYLQQGLRVLAVGVGKTNGNNLQDVEPVGIVVLSDTIRSDASDIIRQFRDNGVAVKVISGDNPLTVSVIAGKVGIPDADMYVSLEGMTDEQVAEVANIYTVFGRVSPEQKAILVQSIKRQGRTVAMTGDGVNDILAMRESDCAITIGSGTDAAKTVAHLVLSDDKFASMPSVVAEGRQVVNNVQNSSTLFLMKTTMTVLATVLFWLLPYAYPFEPKHLYGIEFGITGIASFLLAFKPNHDIIKGNFIVNILKRMLPSGLAMFLAVALPYAFGGLLGVSEPIQYTTMAMFGATFVGLGALLTLLHPYDEYNLFVGGVCTAFIVGVVTLFKWVNDNLIADSTPYISSLPTGAVIFTVCTVILLIGFIVGGKILLNKLENKQNHVTASDK